MAMNVPAFPRHRSMPVSPPRPQARSGEPAERAPTGRADRPATHEARGPEPSTSGKQASHGVLRLLQEGHFRGVADVRLRMNFFDALAPREQAHRAESTRGVLTAFADELTARAGAISETLGSEAREALSTLAKSFEAATVEALAAFEASESSALEPLVAEVEAAFDVFLGSAQHLLAPSTAETTGTPETAGETSEDGGTAAMPTATDEQSGVSEFLSQLPDLLSQSVEALREAGTSSSLPPLSAPSGEGVAYEKFVAQYRETQASLLSSPLGSPIDLTA